MSSVQKSPEHADHTFAVEKWEEGYYQAVFPEPLADFSQSFRNEADAYYHLLEIRRKTPGADQWLFDDPASALEALYTHLHRDPWLQDIGILSKRWLSYTPGAPEEDILRDLELDLWPNADRLQIAKDLWRKMRELPVDRDGFLESEWLMCLKGHPWMELWLWFEHYFGVKIATDLMDLD